MFQQQNLNLLETQNCVFLVLRVQRFSFPKHLTVFCGVKKYLTVFIYAVYVKSAVCNTYTLWYCCTAPAATVKHTNSYSHQKNNSNNYSCYSS